MPSFFWLLPLSIIIHGFYYTILKNYDTVTSDRNLTEMHLHSSQVDPSRVWWDDRAQLMIHVALNIRPLRHRHLIRGKSSIHFTSIFPTKYKHLHLMSATVLACSMAAGGADPFEVRRVLFQVVTPQLLNSLQTSRSWRSLSSPY
jgi:hypothetical protein